MVTITKLVQGEELIRGLIDNTPIIDLVVGHDGKWKVGMSTAFPVDVVEARLYHEVYDQAFRALDRVMLNQKPKP